MVNILFPSFDYSLAVLIECALISQSSQCKVVDFLWHLLHAILVGANLETPRGQKFYKLDFTHWGRGGMKMKSLGKFWW